MSKRPKLLIELNENGDIDATFSGNIQSMASLIVDVMEESEPIRNVILTAAVTYHELENQDLE